MTYLYKRDYNLGITDDEAEKYKSVTGREYKYRYQNGKAQDSSLYPKACRMCRTLFPNNYLDTVDLRNTDKICILNNNYNNQLSLFENEREILNYIKNTESYHIIGSILRGLSFFKGNHGVFLFPEFQLGNEYQVDYLLVAHSSGGFEFFFIELEKPHGSITLRNGELGYEFRDGISQLNEWKRWLQSNYSSFTSTIKKYKNPYMELDDEFYTLDLYRFHYIVVAGRRTDFKPLTYAIRREYKRDNDISLIHYDNLYDYSNLLIGEVTY